MVPPETYDSMKFSVSISLTAGCCEKRSAHKNKLGCSWESQEDGLSQVSLGANKALPGIGMEVGNQGHLHHALVKSTC